MALLSRELEQAYQVARRGFEVYRALDLDSALLLAERHRPRFAVAICVSVPPLGRSPAVA